MKGHIFELAWSWYEGYVLYLFWHETKTRLEFAKDIYNATREFGEDYLKQETSWASTQKWTEYVAQRLKERGYTPIKPYAVNFWGSLIIEEGDREDARHFVRAIGEELFTKAIKHNRAIRGQEV